MKAPLLLAVLAALTLAPTAPAVTNVFFNGSQTATLLVSNINAVTIQSGDYRFTYSADGYWSPVVGGPPTGRFFSVFWPTGVQAQAITAGPLLGNGANLTIQRADGKPFDLRAFTGRILANTAGAGGAFEVTPMLGGNDATNAPFLYDATGYSGQSFSYTPMFQHFDTYKVHLWVDWALTALTLVDTNPPVPPTTYFTIAASALPTDAGSVGGAGNYASNSTCALIASANPGWGFRNWTQDGTQVSTSPNYSFTVRSNRTLTANFLPAFTVSTSVSPAYGGQAVGGGTFTSNALVTLTATPTAGFRFLNWTESGVPVSASASYSFNVRNDRSLTANFMTAGLGATFDFDTGSPPVSPGQGLPAIQINNGVSASFTTLSGGWSVQNTFYGWKPAAFSGNFLYPSTWGSTLAVEFSQPVTNFTMSFFTGEVSSEYDTAALVRVTAYTNAAMTFPVATNSARGAWRTGAYPEGTLSFGSAIPFTKVKLEVPSQSPAPSYLLFVDNLVAQLAAPSVVTISASVLPADAGSVTGAHAYLPGEMVLLSAFPNGSYRFANWTENGLEVCATSDYSFTAETNRVLVASFITNSPPLAFGGQFFQLAGQPLAINIADLMWNDYDPDGDPISFAGVSGTTDNGLLLATNATQILVPASALADGFSYTVADSYGATATGSATISIITNVVSRAVALDRAPDGSVVVAFTAVPWYAYQAQRSTNVTYSGSVQTWPVQAGPDGSVWLWDDFTDLAVPPAQAYYRLGFNP